MLKGFIIKENSGLYDVFAENKIYHARARGKFRIGKYSPMVGDNVLFDEKDGYLLEIEDRINEMSRPNLSNVESIIIVASCERPKISYSLILRYILLSEMISVKPVIVISKIDICTDNYYTYLQDILNKTGYKTILFSSKTFEGLNEIKKHIYGKKVVFAGQSGVGKSSLINLLIPGTKQQVQEISDALNRGKHTTRIVEYLKGDDFWVADTPGFSHIEINLDYKNLKEVYPLIKEYNGCCKFKDCNHVNESDCLVKKDLENGKLPKELYDDYLKLLEALKKGGKI